MLAVSALSEAARDMFEIVSCTGSLDLEFEMMVEGEGDAVVDGSSSVERD